MSKWFKDGNGPPQAALERISSLFKRVGTPLYMGIISLEIHYNLGQTQAMLDHLEELKIVRQLTVEEKRGKFDVRGNIYVLCEIHDRHE